MLFLEICDLSKTTFPDRKKHSRNNSSSPVPDDLTGTTSPAGDGDFDRLHATPQAGRDPGSLVLWALWLSFSGC